jgi:UDP-2,3-diacylglucosamine hydrolase
MPRFSWRPDWRALREQALAIAVPEAARPDDAPPATGSPEAPPAGAQGHVYVIADAHLGDARAEPQEFLAMLGRLPEARMIVFLGDLFKVWLAPPKFWNAPVRGIMAGFARLRATGVPIVFVVGNREFLLPMDQATAARMELPFDWIVHGMCVLHWAGRRYGLTHGDLVNRRDWKYLHWRRWSRGRLVSALFRSMPAPLACALAARLEATLARTNMAIKIHYPANEVRAFAEALTPGLDGMLIGHFHRDETLPGVPGRGFLRIVPDWFSRKALLRIDADGTIATLRFGEPRESE